MATRILRLGVIPDTPVGADDVVLAQITPEAQSGAPIGSTTSRRR